MTPQDINTLMLLVLIFPCILGMIFITGMMIYDLKSKK